MKIVNLKGGLGNQFFQYAFGKSLEKETNTTVKYDTSWFDTDADYDHDILYLDFFDTEYEVANREEIESLYPLDRFGKRVAERIYRKSPFLSQAIFNHFSEIGRQERAILKSEPYLFKYSPKVYTTDGDSYFDGYWQASQYVDSVSDTLDKELRLTEPMSEQSEGIDEEIDNSESVSIHIRRGDYTKINNTLPLGYYEKSVADMNSRLDDPQYYVFSDDIEWVKNELEINGNSTYVDHNGAKTAYEDLMLMASCDHNIIANSTFSWWGAWLNRNSDKTVIAPAVWVGWGDTAELDILPNRWHTLSIPNDEA